MLVRDIMSSPVVAVTTGTTIEEAARLMLDRGFTTLPVVTEAGALIGLLTEADLGVASYPAVASAPEDGVTLRPHLVRQVMRAPALAMPADADLAELAAAMVESHQRCLPVVDGGHLAGIVSWRDLLAQVANGVIAPR